MTFITLKSSLVSGFLASVAMLGAATTVSAQTVFVDDAKLIELSPLGAQRLQLTKSIDWGAFAVDIEGNKTGTYRAATIAIAELYMLFETEPGVLVDQAMVLNTPAVMVNSGRLGPFTWSQAPGETKYFAYWDDRGGTWNSNLGYELGRVTPEDLYGWVALTRVGSSLAVTASATAKGAPIVVGSFTAAVPEPEAWALFALGLTGLALARRRV